MNRSIRKILKAEKLVAGINRRNLQFVYPYNPRKYFSQANDKSETKMILKEGNIPIPETYDIIEYSWDIKSSLTKIEQLDEFVMKPANGSGGNGILLLSKKDENKWITPGGKVYNRESLRIHIASIIYGAYAHDSADKCIIEQKINSHPDLNKIYGNGIPDIRVILLMDEIQMAMLRIPTDKSGGKANLHQGAMGIGIDIKSGKLGNGIYRNGQTDKHPNTNVVFKDMILPFWELIREISIKTAAHVPLKFLGVDLILDKDQGPMVIEINARPGLQIQNANMQGLVNLNLAKDE